jgi:hypothetical protein
MQKSGASQVQAVHKLPARRGKAKRRADDAVYVMEGGGELSWPRLEAGSGGLWKGVDFDGLAAANHYLAGDSGMEKRQKVRLGGNASCSTQAAPGLEVVCSRLEQGQIGRGQEVAGEHYLLLEAPVGAGNAEEISQRCRLVCIQAGR